MDNKNSVFLLIFDDNIAYNDVLETSKRRVLYNILSQIFIVKCFTKSLLIRNREKKGNTI